MLRYSDFGLGLLRFAEYPPYVPVEGAGDLGHGLVPYPVQLVLFVRELAIGIQFLGVEVDVVNPPDGARHMEPRRRIRPVFKTAPRQRIQDPHREFQLYLEIMVALADRARVQQIVVQVGESPQYLVECVGVLGQVPGDAALYGLDLDAWAQRTCAALLAQGRTVRYRPHPLVRRCGDVRCPAGATGSTGSLDEDLAGAALAVTFNSTAGVEAVLAGVPTVALDVGAMAWPVTTHDLASVQTPEREPWAHRLAWCQWTIEEIASGLAWEHLAAAGERRWGPCH